MEFIVDESAGTAVVEHLRGVGHDVLAVAEAMPQADDQNILARAMLLRLRDERPSNRVRVMKDLLGQYAHRLAGHFTVATDSGVRIRPARPPS